LHTTGKKFNAVVTRTEEDGGTGGKSDYVGSIAAVSKSRAE